MQNSSRLLLTLPLVFATHALAANGPRLVPTPVQKVFTPQGFDDNDNVEVVIHGHFANTCYKTGPASADVDYQSNTVTITAQAYLYGGSCGQVMIPFIQTVKLGVLKQGTYQIIVRDSPQATTTPLTVLSATTANADDYLYAPIETADLTGDAQSLRLEGSWPYTLVGCMVMKEVRIELTEGNVLVVRPIAEFANGTACDGQRSDHKFAIETPLPTRLVAGEYLLHVRVLNGEAVNRFAVVQGAGN